MGIGTHTGLTTNKDKGGSFDHTEYNTIVDILESGLSDILIEALMADGLIWTSPNALQVDTSTARFTAPSANKPVAGVIQGNLFRMTSAHEYSGTATGGTTTSLVDGSLSQADNYWNGAYVIFTGGTHSGSVREVSGYNLSDTTLSWTSALSSAVSSGDTYIVTFFYIQGLSNSSQNYVFGRRNSRTPDDLVIDWVSNTTGTVDQAGDILVATVTLDGSGNVTSSDNDPTNAKRLHYNGVGAHDVIKKTGTHTISGSTNMDITCSHDYLLYRGGVRVSSNNSDVNASCTEYYKPDETVIRLSNVSSYSRTATYTLYIEGRKRRYYSE